MAPILRPTCFRDRLALETTLLKRPPCFRDHCALETAFLEVLRVVLLVNKERCLFRVMKGGADTGFRHVKPEEYTPRLLHFSGTRKQVEVREVSRKAGNLKHDDVFILDMGMKIYQWNGSASNKDERMKVRSKLLNTSTIKTPLY